ncbi:MAG: helix-turn-helix transcriptional regulator [Oscillospiraceae bacterium]|nr:helix-turn-helix transcriptional regulator [Oscillospiraceae bacterium]
MDKQERIINVPGGAKQLNLSDWTLCDAGLQAGLTDRLPDVFFDCFRVVTDIEVVVRVPVNKDSMLYWMRRTNHGLMFQLSGQMKYCYGDQEFIVREGDIFYFPKGKKYRGIPVTPSAVCLCVNFQVSEELFCQPQVYRWECSRKVEGLFEQLNITWLQQGNSFQCMSLLYEIMSRVYTAHHANYASPQKKARFLKVRNYIDNHFTEPDLSVTSISNAVGISSVYIRKLFSEFALMSTTEYITFLRINYAKGLLQEGTMTITEVAEAVGYRDCGHFSKRFKSATGRRPNDFRALP